jgi:mannose-6-phosphate isomerase-like protein (cupin superfamily)
LTNLKHKLIGRTPKKAKQKYIPFIMKKINISEKFSLFNQHWTPKIIGELNGQHLKLAKVKDDFVWHDHKDEDELFIVFKGTLYLDFRDGRTETIGPGEMIIVPKGVEHRPWTADGEEVQLMLVEPKSTKHTGEVQHEKTQTNLEWI